MKFKVEVLINSSGRCFFDVEADSSDEAKRIALDDLAPNNSFFADTTEYKCGEVTPVEP